MERVETCGERIVPGADRWGAARGDAGAMRVRGPDGEGRERAGSPGPVPAADGPGPVSSARRAGIGRPRRTRLRAAAAGVLVASALAGGAWYALERASRIPWIEGDLDRGLAVARRQNRTVLLLATGDW